MRKGWAYGCGGASCKESSISPHTVIHAAHEVSLLQLPVGTPSPRIPGGIPATHDDGHRRPCARTQHQHTITRRTYYNPPTHRHTRPSPSRPPATEDKKEGAVVIAYCVLDFLVGYLPTMLDPGSTRIPELSHTQSTGSIEGQMEWHGRDR